ncbi:aminotransferase class IV [Streptomyces nondiastaticus]|uniref:Aminotransferase class IV n=1 Tax=Streptomyces nondiastaticus TaxID=3154512 RepID=A0ABW6U567_9ACTN
MDDLELPYVQVNGHAMAPDPLPTMLMGGYGHMTAMQVRNSSVQGLGLHLARLKAANRELFGQELDGGLVVGRMRQALDEAGVRDASVRVYVYAPPDGDSPVTMVVVRPPVPAPTSPQRLRSVPYVRPFAHLKHVGVFGQAHHLRRVQAGGFDEALLVGADGLVTEGAITNVGFVEGRAVVWPEGPSLDGITMLLLRRELEQAGMTWRQQPVRLDDVARFDAAFVSNSTGIAPIARIDDISFPHDDHLVRVLPKLYEQVPWDVLA